MIVLFDTNVVLDVLLDREPFVEPAVALFEMVERGDLSGMLCATTLTTVHYLVARALDLKKSGDAIQNLLQLFEIAPVTRAVLESALHSGMEDYEDAVLHQSACMAGCGAIVTRNGRDFKNSQITIYTPQELHLTLQALKDLE